jgi:hypothetical protein
MKLIKALLCASLITGYPTIANANTVVCQGKVDRLSYHANNKLMIKLDSMNQPVFFCSPDTEWSVSGTSYVTGPETCKTMYSTFLAAQMSGKTISSMYFDGDDVSASCSEWGTWKAANIRHFALAK